MVYAYENQAKALLAMGTCLNSDGLGIMRMHIYHSCQKDHPVMISGLEDGFASGYCPLCGDEFTQDNTEYDLELIVKYNIKLED